MRSATIFHEWDYREKSYVKFKQQDRNKVNKAIELKNSEKLLPTTLIIYPMHLYFCGSQICLHFHHFSVKEKSDLKT